jgi:uncharacterized protein
MSLKKRYIHGITKEFLDERIVLIGGPRQVGKTTFAQSFISNKDTQYYNWDSLLDRDKIKKNQIQFKNKVVVLDEIHKFKFWRNILKGAYDKNKPDVKLIVTGSARLDHYRRGGDSLFGRSRFIRLHPLSVGELGILDSNSDLENLLIYGGFPEPFLKSSARFHRLWQKERIEKLIKEDIRDLENVRDLSLIDLLADSLLARAGSTLSLKSIQEDLEVSHDSIRKWLAILENLYLVFRIPPFGSPKIRAVKKEKKLYFWDWSSITDPGVRFENLVASHLLKYCHYLEDSEGYKMELRFIRDTDKREIDFVVIRDKKPIFAVECKTGEKSLSKSINYFKERTSIPEFYQVHLGEKDYGQADKGGRVLPFLTFSRIKKLP